jgi:branched-chain amino acid aminotransferase
MRNGSDCPIVCIFVHSMNFMMSECYGKNFILNGELQPVVLFDNKMVYEGESVYEVIRLVKGSPVFFNDHMERLVISIRNQKKDLPADMSAIAKSIIRLTRSERKNDINIKIVFNYKNGSQNWLVYFIESVYPTVTQYKNGVRGILFKAERKDPESKLINHRLRSEITNWLLIEKGYEALLVNPDNMITEGSRSNVFFLKNSMLVTAPDDLILKGITRKHILDICSKNGIIVKFECVKANDISGYESAFMTGTSPMVLPYCCIDDIRFNVKLPLLEELRRQYVLKVEESIRLFRPDY